MLMARAYTPPSPFVSSAVEARRSRARPMGVSTMLDTNGQGASSTLFHCQPNTRPDFGGDCLAVGEERRVEGLEKI